MALSVKYKIRFGTLFLLLLLVVSSGVGIYYQLTLAKAAKNILVANYESLQYAHDMQEQLNSSSAFPAIALARFDSSLKKQERNVTEPGEFQTTRDLRNAYNSLQKNPSDTTERQIIRERLGRILSLNMRAIERKNKEAQQAAQTAYTFIILVTSISLLIGLTFAFNFPFVVVTPIRKLMDAIKEISVKNYRYRIHLERQDEFGQLAAAFNIMSERLEGFENSNLNRLIFEKARAEAVINSMKDASIGIDKDNKLLFANQQALQLLGMSAEEAVGKKTDILRGQNDLFRFLVENDSTAPFKIVVDGRENFYIKEQVDVEQGGSTSKVIVLKNITSFKEMDVAKTNFIATVSHELKTPLASSDFSLKLLEDSRVGNLSDEQKQLVDQLKNDNQRMLRILSELLNMSQVEAGRIQLTISRIDPYQVIAGSIAAVAGAAREKQISIVQNVPAGLAPINGDADKIGWVLNNFFTNAIKFSVTQGVVSLTVEDTESGLVFSVMDRGPGIPAEYLIRVFERYFQVPGRQDIKGSGIGLAICKEFIEAMGGSAWVDSMPGEGSVFSFRLPKV
ncbi:sensor histidine kinase [Sediminibacterium soli]|uniref:sensor histidine kinase n=1 Tax=Sediminibacterium soli TaxID=2698829 RepID=UPI00137B5DE0|nr:ATP-binding protein [Sediminibacterium soli]NCI46737.1 HAMP domain-containing protein [Sediminibacterium soli]